MSNRKNGTADQAVPGSMGEIAHRGSLLLGQPGLPGLVGYAVYRLCVWAWRLTDDNAAASASDRQPDTEARARPSRPSWRGLAGIAVAVAFAAFATPAAALPFGAIGVLAPQLGLAASIPVVGAVVIGAVAVAATGYTVYRACSGSDTKREDGK